ncbi:MAG TPA: ATP-binding SpoIIE family protein phosphatase [Nitrospira sp.]|nr:ATP-binding SpoIIE family protein phosphatase [Nitrospira sp.]
MTGHRVHEQVEIPIREPTQVGEARRRVTTLATRAGLDETQAGTCAVIASEMATNLVKHAQDGDIVLRTLGNGAVGGIEMISIDRGPGIDNINRAIQDGHSTAGSSGSGLGAMRRMASEFDVHSLPGRGTVLVARVWERTASTLPTLPRFLTGVICLPIPGEQVSGDAWLSESSGRRTLCAVVDGLGHGPLAAEAAQLAIKTFRAHPDLALSELTECVHDALRSTRGAVFGAAEILHDQRLINFVGVGNIMAAVHLNGTSRHLVFQDGILGHQIGRIKELQYPWTSESMFVMCSDGIKTQWAVNPYQGLVDHDPSLIAATLYRDFSRGRDDTTVMVLKAVSSSVEQAGT